MSRVLAWFSCGAASAVASKLAVEKYGRERTEVVYCDTLAHEHPDNARFMRDVEEWIGQPIKVIQSKKYADIYEVFEKTRYLVGPHGARCTVELKKLPRREYQRVNDTHVFGLTFDEEDRIAMFEDNNGDLDIDWILEEERISKANCYARLKAAGIELPAMYALGYNNNNCIGCVKGGSGYWNKIRRDFPDAFARMAKMERKLNVAINKRYEGDCRIRVFLDELPPDAGRDVPLPDIECGAFCVPSPDSDAALAAAYPLFHGHTK